MRLPELFNGIALVSYFTRFSRYAICPPTLRAYARRAYGPRVPGGAARRRGASALAGRPHTHDVRTRRRIAYADVVLEVVLNVVFDVVLDVVLEVVLVVGPRNRPRGRSRRRL